MQDSCQSASRLRYTQVIKIERYRVQLESSAISPRHHLDMRQSAVTSRMSEKTALGLEGTGQVQARAVLISCRDSRTVGPVTPSCKLTSRLSFSDIREVTAD